MKAVKIIVGVLASLFAVAHVVGFFVAVMGHRRYEGTLEYSRYFGHIVGLCVGVAVAIACFRRRGS